MRSPAALPHSRSDVPRTGARRLVCRAVPRLRLEHRDRPRRQRRRHRRRRTLRRAHRASRHRHCAAQQRRNQDRSRWPFLRTRRLRQRRRTRRAAGRRARLEDLRQPAGARPAACCSPPMSARRAKATCSACATSASRQAGARKIDAFIVVDGANTDHITTRALGSRRFEVTFNGPGGHSWSDYGVAQPAARALPRGGAVLRRPPR